MGIASQQITPNPMGSRSGVDILSIQDDLKNLSDQQLSVAMQSGTPTYLVASEKNRRVNMRKDFEARKSAQEGTVVQDLFSNQQPLAMGRMQQSVLPKPQGLQSLPGSPEQPVMQMQRGGLIDFIKQQEYFQPTMYDDAGNRAIGYGYNLSPQEIQQGFITLSDGTQVPLEGGITEKVASSLLEQRLGDNFRAGSNILRESGVDVDSLSPNVRNALQDLTYQTGGGIFNKSPRLVEALRRNDPQAIAEELKTTGRLVDGEILPGTNQRAYDRSAMVSDGREGIMSTVTDAFGDIFGIGTAEASMGRNIAEGLSRGMREGDQEGLKIKPQDQAIIDAITEYDETKAREADKEREIGFFENIFEEGSDKDRVDVIDSLINQYAPPSRFRGEAVTQGALDASKGITELLNQAKSDKEQMNQIINLARTGETLTVENVKAITGDYVPPELRGTTLADAVGTPDEIAKKAEDMKEARDALLKVPEKAEEGLSSDERQSARQLAFLEAGLRVASSDSPTIAGGLGAAVPAIQSYRDELDNISQRKYRDAQAQYYASGGTQSQQYNSIMREADSYLKNFNALPTVGAAEGVLKTFDIDDPIINDAIRKLNNLGLKPDEITADKTALIKSITLNALTQYLAKRRGLDFGGLGTPSTSGQDNILNSLK